MVLAQGVTRCELEHTVGVGRACVWARRPTRQEKHGSDVYMSDCDFFPTIVDSALGRFGLGSRPVP